MVIYTNHIPEGFAGRTNGFIIRIRPEYKDDRGLLEHEKVHVQQFWRWGIFHSLLYLLNDHYRLEAEIEAYKKQLEYNPEHFDLYANAICTKYRLDEDIEYVKLRLRS